MLQFEKYFFHWNSIKKTSFFTLKRSDSKNNVPNQRCFFVINKNKTDEKDDRKLRDKFEKQTTPDMVPGTQDKRGKKIPHKTYTFDKWGKKRYHYHINNYTK